MLFLLLIDKIDILSINLTIKIKVHNIFVNEVVEKIGFFLIPNKKSTQFSDL